MRIVFAGSPEVAVPALDFFLESAGHELAAVLSRPDAPKGRGRKLVASAVAARTIAAGVPLYQPVTLRNNPAALEFLSSLDADLGVVVAYGAILPPEVLSIPRHGWINVHFSMLPRWRGAAPVQRALEAGDETGGVTVFRLEEDLDTGPVYASLPHTFREDASAGEVLAQLSKRSLEPLAVALGAIGAGTAPVPQAAQGVTYAAQLTSAQGQIDWSRSAREIRNQVRGFTPAPGAWTLFHGQRMKVGLFDMSADPAEEKDLPTLLPGSIFVTRRAVWVGTGTEAICLNQVAPAGKKHMHAADWARGARLESGMVLGEQRVG